MHPLPFEKVILRRIVPTWQELICDHIGRGSFTSADVSLGKCRKRSLPTAERRVGLTNAFLIVSPGCDPSRLLFYLLLYIINPLHVYDSLSCRYSISVLPDAVTEKPPLALQNVDMALRSRSVYRRIFDLALEYTEESKERGSGLLRHLFQNMKLRRAVEVGTRLILVLGLMPEESVATAKHFAHIIKSLCYSTAETPNMMSVRLPLPTFIEGTVVAQDREKIYVEGGIYCVPSRILLVDLLTAKLSPELVSGLIIVNAHRMTHDYNIPFLIKLLRSRNRVAFIKAITDNVTAMRDDGKLTFVLKSLFTDDCFIFPRCSTCFDSFLNDPRVQPETLEVNLKLSDSSKQIHNTIVQVLQRLVADIQRQCGQELQHLDMNMIMYSPNVNRLLASALQKARIAANEYHIRRSLASIANLRMLLDQLHNMDALSFLAFAESMKTAESDSQWIWTSFGTTIYKLATARVYEPDPEAGSGLAVKVEVDKKGEYIRQVLCNKYVGCEELGELLRSAMKWQTSKRPYKTPSRYKRVVQCANLSFDAGRRALCRREANHIIRICRFLQSGGVLCRRAIIVADNEFLCRQLSSSLTMSLDRYNEVKFMAYATKCADRFDSAESEEQKFGGYAQAHFHRVMLNNRNETDKLLRRFVIWSKYNDIYRSNTSSNRGTQTGSCPTQPSFHNELSEDASYGREVGTYDEIDRTGSGITPERMHLMDGDVPEPITADLSGDSDYSGMETSPGKKDVSQNSISRYINRYTLTLNVSKEVKCITHVINVSRTQARSDPLKGLMERKLLEDDDESLPLSCSPHEFSYVLQRVKPTVIIVYRPSVKIFRVIEQYCALRATVDRRKYLRVYVLSYSNCLESHKFARDLKHELECWRHLQQQLKTLQITFDESVLLQGHTEAERQAALSDKSATSQSNALGQIADLQPALHNVPAPTVRPCPQVLVDLREFGSKLPFHLYYKGLKLVPILLEMGDYLLTRDICVERKSLNDLISSLNTGRLVQQVCRAT
ncbi:DNA repair endonuclease XPF [Babesia sp. Xinjiang]|uniref:DNA repair endonuclease XPF n=1 Tax=Babesia sp. Xinjiang TaxID=462227 RepID=UPI000A21B016|nr:DNA repair endonuclease XPF [Babesia sp. Xinjiang]ORM41342.1 DNA repair endonuclease XPF [Babesia sp. Xinjiang]